MKCPNCGSSKVESNKICHKGSGGHVAHAGTHATLAGHPVGALALGGMYAVAKTVDQFTENYKCKGCGHKFS